MRFKQGNTYTLNATIKNVDIQDINKVVFKFNEIEKTYKEDGTGDVELDGDKFVISLSQEETLQLCETVYYEVAVKFTNEEVKRSKVECTDSLETIINKEI